MGIFLWYGMVMPPICLVKFFCGADCVMSADLIFSAFGGLVVNGNGTGAGVRFLPFLCWTYYILQPTELLVTHEYDPCRVIWCWSNYPKLWQVYRLSFQPSNKEVNGFARKYLHEASGRYLGSIFYGNSMALNHHNTDNLETNQYNGPGICKNSALAAVEVESVLHALHLSSMVYWR